MMQSTINLLPPSKKTRLKKLVKFILAQNILEWSVLTFSFLAIFILWGWMTLQTQFNYLTSSTLLIDRERIADSEDIKSININSRGLSEAGRDFAVMTDKFLELAEAVPADVRLSSLDIDRQSGATVLNGTARTRDALLNYQDILNGVSWMAGIESPISQLFQRENINFEFKSDLKGFPPLRTEQNKKPAPGANVSDD